MFELSVRTALTVIGILRQSDEPVKLRAFLRREAVDHDIEKVALGLAQNWRLFVLPPLPVLSEFIDCPTILT